MSNLYHHFLKLVLVSNCQSYQCQLLKLPCVFIPAETEDLSKVLAAPDSLLLWPICFQALSSSHKVLTHTASFLFPVSWVGVQRATAASEFLASPYLRLSILAHPKWPVWLSFTKYCFHHVTLLYLISMGCLLNARHCAKHFTCITKIRFPSKSRR